MLVEKTANGPALISRLTRNQRRRVIEITPRGSKSARLRPHLETILASHVHLPEAADFNAEFIAEFVAFPHGRYTDQVDAFSQYMDWVQKRVERGDLHPPTSSPAVIAAACNSQARPFKTNATGSGLIAVSSNTVRFPNEPVPVVKAWIRF